tara:strand:- start:692 stop:1399 length:708 start_codon:yes stop_codon:yes gene_type:complete
VIHKNIKLSFPHLNNIERMKIVNQFHIFIFELFAEIIKSINFKKKDILKRVHINNIEIIEKNISQKKPLILICSHYHNWEWLFLRISLIPNIKLAAAYKPLRNTYFNNLMYQMRSKFGAILVPSEKWKYFIANNKEKPYIFLFMSDQVPAKKSNGKHIHFLSQSTLVDKGAERISQALNINVVYSEITKRQKGYYSINLKPLNSKDITKEYMQMLEKSIQKKPQYWLWSHNRWKR